MLELRKQQRVVSYSVLFTAPYFLLWQMAIIYLVFFRYYDPQKPIFIRNKSKVPDLSEECVQ